MATNESRVSGDNWWPWPRSLDYISWSLYWFLSQLNSSHVRSFLSLMLIFVFFALNLLILSFKTTAAFDFLISSTIFITSHRSSCCSYWSANSTNPWILTRAWSPLATTATAVIVTGKFVNVKLFFGGLIESFAVFLKFPGIVEESTGIEITTTTNGGYAFPLISFSKAIHSYC